MSANKDAVEQMAAGGWILEMAELTSMARSEVESQKAFISRTVDFVRLAYAHRAQPFPRKCVFYATSNDYEYLKARENRRFWPIHVQTPEIDMARMERERDQLWAEVMDWYRALLEAGHDYRRLPFGLEGEAKEESMWRQDAARVETADDQDAGKIAEWLNTPVPRSTLMNGHLVEEDCDPLVVRTKTCAAEIAEEVFRENRLPYRKQKNLMAKSINDTFRLPGTVLSAEWVKYAEVSDTSKEGRLIIGKYGQQRAWVRRGTTKAELDRGYRIVANPGGA